MEQIMHKSQTGTKISPLEMETLKPMTVRQSPSTSRGRDDGAGRVHPLDQLIMMIRLHMEYYPKISGFLIICAMGAFLYFLITSVRKPVTRNRLSHDYSKMENNYNFKASQLDHWCLWGGDDKCNCEDFTDPLSREEKKGWLETHRANMKRIESNKIYDVVFYGDEIIEGWNGMWLNMPMILYNQGKEIHEYWNSTFTRAGGGPFDSLALGIMGDVSPNLLWRLQHGEMPETLKAKVFWLHIGANDLARGGCSEEAVVLGILRVAEEIHFQNPNSVVVIQSILPRTTSRDGKLDISQKAVSRVFNTVLHVHGKHNMEERAHSVDEARRQFHLWPSIQNINQQLAKFCENHDDFVYFDADELFLGSMGNEHYRTKEKMIISDLMPDMVHPSYDGYRVMGTAIVKELVKIIHENNLANDIEVQGGGWR